MKKVILVRYGEIMLKGLNRPVFETTVDAEGKAIVQTARVQTVSVFTGEDLHRNRGR